jgi:N6-L-threonylcarbamoyladenine synthase
VLLAIESSCDDTSAALCVEGEVVCNMTAGQAVHAAYGGVVPELASRAHQQNIYPLVDQVLKTANIDKKALTAIAYTRGPGLVGSLMVGMSFAKGLSLALNIPLIEVHHMQAHVLAHFIDEPKPSFPFLCLTVSGGHTQIIRVNDFSSMELLGETQDDAAGEAFDKSAKILGLPYPGGPLVDLYASKGDANAFQFPYPAAPGLNFSFSGLKTSFLYLVQDAVKADPQFIEKNLHDLCASIQYRINSILLSKVKKASLETGIKSIAIAGGVAANKGLRSMLNEKAIENDWQVFIPDFQYCTDNAGMIAMAAWYKYLANDFGTMDADPLPRWKIW